MESWLPWLVDDDLLITNVLPDTAKVVLVEPRRMRDRADDLLAEEDDLARSLASTWARDADRTFPRLHAETDRLLVDRPAHVDHQLHPLEPRRTHACRPAGGDPWWATARAWPCA